MNYQEIKKLLTENCIFQEVKTLFKKNGGTTINEISAILHVKANIEETEAKKMAMIMINTYSSYFKLEK
jgi:hypothetical protein